MKTFGIRSLATAFVGGAIVLSANAEKVDFEKLPVQLKEKIRTHTGSAAVEDVDRQTKGGQTVYEVGFKKNGEHTELMFDSQGRLLNDSGEAAALDSRKISYNELPDAVRKAADARLKGAEVNDVDRAVRDGKANYEIGFRQNGQQQELLVSQEGRILNDSPAAAVGAPASATSGQGSSSTLVPQPVTLSSSSKVELSATPSAVQKAIATAAAGARIEDVERGTWQGQNVYQAAFKENGKHVELQLREDGTLLHDPRKTAMTRRGILGRSNASNASASTTLVPLSSAEKVEHSSLPGAVQRAINVHAGSSRKIEDIERGTWQGRTVYQIAFKDDAGNHTELQLDEKGKVIHDQRSAR